MKNKVGRIQVYTGDGKGKTTAALGLALRARGRGWRVAIIFFDKGGNHYGEREMLAQVGIDFWVTGLLRFDELKKKFRFGVTAADQMEGIKGLDLVRAIFQKNNYDLLILDEINSSLCLGIVEQNKFISLLGQKPQSLELVLTGRQANEKILKLADLVTEMQPRKHYFNQGQLARAGVEY
ncbi:MAG: cob(I)yrinic acid a,c-diamide adenosyltransferase [Candidatus Komeilibacteria bacterium CG_4_10_14_0_2_um_filter_37_10]|uniref:Cob(I)yrinic acid a,c-diamide adenosyltransferase n=1 Tax=Candidatus Komeilibacteria bacterium CG_4_10_14_0_2_um_filter_37_10 TaxID=1974470 RepID=A0A2M7VGL8_9BACT|nr:MAG: cob(I)yrinic acid a,c-diamide adenosyltransferase [Candidatus Komeilibacteria bacterium CG_4_10_14_0_2_um_filter_37_10]PJA93414.1 MAG: cob(I)yrinic acid a,c-diamide adenosyltransferase [Candidatus Komeilibacteria bacterium CG_4_9_14_3_um_filter_37_5]